MRGREGKRMRREKKEREKEEKGKREEREGEKREGGRAEIVWGVGGGRVENSRWYGSVAKDRRSSDSDTRKMEDERKVVMGGEWKGR